MYTHHGRDGVYQEGTPTMVQVVHPPPWYRSTPPTMVPGVQHPPWSQGIHKEVVPGIHRKIVPGIHRESDDARDHRGLPWVLGRFERFILLFLTVIPAVSGTFLTKTGLKPGGKPPGARTSPKSVKQWFIPPLCFPALHGGFKPGL